MFIAVIIENEEIGAKSAFQVSALSEIPGNPEAFDSFAKLGKLILTTPQKFKTFSHFTNQNGFGLSKDSPKRDTITASRSSYEIVGLSRDDFMKYARQEIAQDPVMREVRLYGEEYKALFPK